MVLAADFAAPCASWREILSTKSKPGNHTKLIRLKSGYGNTIHRYGHGSYKTNVHQSSRFKSRHGNQYATSNSKRRCNAQGM